MAWRPTVAKPGKPLPEPTMTLFIDFYNHHSVLITSGEINQSYFETIILALCRRTFANDLFKCQNGLPDQDKDPLSPIHIWQESKLHKHPSNIWTSTYIGNVSVHLKWLKYNIAPKAISCEVVCIFLRVYCAYVHIHEAFSVLQWRHNGRDGVSNHLFTQPFNQAQAKQNIKAPRYWPLCGEFTGDLWIPRTNDQ